MDKSILLAKDTLDISKFEFRQIRQSEPEWIYELRKAGWDNFRASPLPERSDHLWRYTDPAVFMPEGLDRLVSGDRGKPRQGLNGGFLISDNESDLKNKGVIFENLSNALINHGGILKEYLGKAINAEFGKFESANMALWDKGLFLQIPDNIIISEPIHVKFIPSSDFSVRRALYVIGENSEVTIIDDYSANQKFLGLLTNSALEMFIGNNSKVRYLLLNRLETDHTLYLTSRAVTGSDAAFESFYAGFGGGLSKISAGATLQGRGANSRMTGLIFSDGQQRTDYHTRHHHRSGETFSNLDFKVVLKDKAKSAYTGLIRIERDAPDCEAYQENRNLLLSEGAKAESVPELEILTDQVRCSHGATMGPVDPELIFYLKSRGISESQAIKLIINGFFESTLAGTPEIFKGIVKEELTSRLGAE